jgi:NitT/TauT family transport system substrate-binding protein
MGKTFGAFALFASLLLSNGARADGPLEINIGGPSAGYYTLYVAQELGLFEKQGLVAKFYWFATGAPLLAGLKSKSIDVTTTGLSTVFALDQKIPLKILYWEMDHGAGDGLVVPKDSPIKSYKDLGKAKAIGAATGTCAQVNLAVVAKKVGLKVGDLNVINIAPPLYENAFKGGSIDAAFSWAPYSIILADAGYHVVNWDEDYGGVCPSTTSVRTDFLEQHPDVGVKLARINQEVREIIAKNPQLAIKALMKNLSLSESVAKVFYERHCCAKSPTFEEQLSIDSPYSLTSKTGGLAKQLLIASQMLYETGTLRSPVSLETINDAIDPSFIQRVQKDR